MTDSGAGSGSRGALLPGAPRRGAPLPGAPSSGDAAFVAAVSVFVFRGGRLLALRRASNAEAAPGAWDVVSGRVQAGEHPHAAALREAREESGLEVAVEPAPITAYTAKRLRSDMLVVGYRGRSEAGEVRISSEHDDSAWMTLEEFARACPFPALVDAANLAADANLAAAGRAAHVIVWEFRARSGSEAAFESAYGPEGDWAQFFRRDPAYRSTELLRAGGERRYLTIDRWASRAAFEAFKERHGPEYAAIDRRCEALTEHEAPLGDFLPLPADRFAGGTE